MKDDELLKYIFNGGNFSSPTFSQWVKSCERFKVFVEKHTKKILNKVTKAQKDTESNGEALKDVLFELEIAYLLHREDCFSNIEYELYKSQKGPNPDFTVTYEARTTFNVDVKRIRESKPETRLEAWKKQVGDKTRSIPSILSVDIRILKDKFDASSDWLNRLEDKTLDIVEFIERMNTFHGIEQTISVGEAAPPHPVPGFENEVEIVFRRPPNNWTNTLYLSGGEFPVFNTHKDYGKFGDIICDVIRQTRPDDINVVVISTRSDSYGYFDFSEAIISLAKQATLENDDFFRLKKFAGADDFIKQTRRLSGVLFRSAWIPALPDRERNILWCNEDVDYPIPEDIREALRRID